MAAHSQLVGQTLGHYRILEQIGAGGMGVVYRAHDTRLDRDVALKVLPSGALAGEAAKKRFRKEALTLSKLSHSNIAQVYDFDAQDGLDFLVMEYVDGVTLAEKLGSRALREKEVLSLAEQIAKTLQDAHECGIIHRDLKPGNIILTPKGQVKLLDFGLARLLQPTGATEATESFTEPHGAGTLPYMAPEQLRGDPADFRIDIYAAGVVLYEMATGQRPFEAKVSTALADDIIHKPATPPRWLNPTLSPKLEDIILKCLEKDPANRYQSAKELTVDIRRLASPIPVEIPAVEVRLRWRRAVTMAVVTAVAVSALLFILNVGRWRERLFRQTNSGHIESLAVLPLENLSGDPEQEYFADGMIEALITDLSKIGALRVISRTSAMHYKGTTETLPQIARELNVDAVVEGSVMRSENRVRVTAQLIHAPTDRHLWAESYEEDQHDILSLQSKVASAIVHEIETRLTSQEQARLASTRPVNLEAHEAYLKGRYYWDKRTQEGLKKSIAYFDLAIAKDPNYAVAYAGLADSYTLFSRYGILAAREAFPKAKAAALKALEIDDQLAEAHATLGEIKASYDWDWGSAEKEFKRALELNPGSPMPHYWYSYSYLTPMGRHAEAIIEMKRALELDPLSLMTNTNLAGSFFEARQYDQAIEQLQKTIELDPNFGPAHAYLAEVYLQKRMYHEATAENLGDTLGIARIYGLSGRKSEALRFLPELREGVKHMGVSAFEMALVYAALEERDEAFAFLERAYAERSEQLTYLNVEPGFDSLRPDPRFQDLLRRVGLQ
jgi:serine/threonine protein kinase